MIRGILAQRRRGSPPLPLPEFDYLVILGSSTPDQVFGLNSAYGRQEQSARRQMTDAGYDIPIISKAVSGSTIASLNSNVNTYLASLGPISPADPSRVAVVINIGNNDIGVTDYASMAEATKEAMILGLRQIVDKVSAFGFTPILGTVNSRKAFAEMYEVWADLMYRPLVSELMPYWTGSGLATFDYCRLYLENKDVFEWWQLDNTHPKNATMPYQRYTADQLGSKAILPPASTSGERFLFHFPVSARIVGGLNSIPAAASATLTTVVDTNGNVIAGASFGWTGATGSSGGVRPNPGDFSVSLSSNEVQSGTVYANAGLTITFTAELGAAYADRTGTLRVTASSNAAGRLTRIACGGASAVIAANGPGVQIIELPFTMSAAGALIFTATNQSPSTFTNVSGAELVFD